MATRDQPMVMKDFAGVNRRDGGDKVLSNQFFTLQNFFPYSKGLLYKRQGTTLDLDVSTLPLAQKIMAFHRHYGAFGERFSLHFVLPDATAFPTATVAPTLTEIAGGDMFNGGTPSQINFTYSWVGAGCESFYAPQASITVSDNTKGVRITVPAFPAGVKSANIFLCIPGEVMTIAGVVTTSGGSYDFKFYAGPTIALNDTAGEIKNCDPQAFLTGNLKRGTYYIACAPFTKKTTASLTKLGTAATGNGNYFLVRLTDDNKSIRVASCLTTGGSGSGITTNGATHVIWFISSKPPTEGPMTFAGISKMHSSTDATSATAANSIQISSLTKSTNFQAFARQTTFGASGQIYSVYLASETLTDFMFTTSLGYVDRTARTPFVIRKDSDGSISEVVMARRPESDGAFTYTLVPNEQSVKSRLVTPTKIPIFTSFLGAVYMANGGVQPLIQTDGYSMQEQAPASGTVLPGPADYVSSFKNGLIVTVPDYRNQIFGTNAMAPNNFASGGTGTSLRFVTIGDPYGDGVKGVGIFSFTSGTEGPKSFLMATKKSSTWIISNITDLQSGIPASMDQLSGRVGCLASRTMVQTPIGFVYLGNDGDIYLSRGSGEPYRIGGSVRPILQHLENNDTLMAMATASYQMGFYKLSYPSSPTSTTNDAQLWADLRTEQGVPITWSGPHLGVNVGSQEVFLSEGDNQNRYGLLADGSKFVLLDDPSTFLDLGQPIVSKLVSKTFRFNTEMNFKRLTSIVLDAYYDTQFAHSVLFEAFMDDQYTQYNKTLSSGTAVWDSSQFDQGLWGDAFYQLVSWFIGPAPLVGRTLIFQLTHSSNAQFILAAIGATIQVERRQIV